MNSYSKALRAQLIHFASMPELKLDFGEEEVEFANRAELKKLILNILNVIRELIHSFQLGNAIKKGVPTVIAGRPYAGKSTLLNILLEEDRAIVSDIAGTTRDTIEEILNIHGIEFRLIDTAGIREAHDQIESIGVQKTMEKIQQSAVLIYMFDVAEMGATEVWEDLQKLTDSPAKLLVVANKMDLNPYLKAEEYISELLSPEQFIPVSALNQMYIEFLKEKLFATVVEGDLNLENPVVSNARHLGAFQQCAGSLVQALKNIEADITSDFVAMDVRQAIHYLGEITGEISTDDLLENIFRNFCIGK